MRRSLTFLIALAFIGSGPGLHFRPVVAGHEPAAQPAAPVVGRKRALLVGISGYCRGNDQSQCMAGKKYWWNLNSAPDVEALEYVLKNNFGFDEVKVLKTKEETTHKHIVGTFRSFLIDQTSKNDIVYFHYSGHGSQVPDDDKHGPNPSLGDEIDGLDETLVPSDYISQEDGSNDIRDDEIGQLLTELRAKKPANVTLTMDSCFSGSNTRGGNTLVRGRAWQGPKPTPRVGRGVEESPSGLFARDEANAQGYVVLSAARNDQLANETYDEATGKQMGMFTSALVSALKNADDATTYRDIFERINDRVTRRFRNQEPQIEGKMDSLLMSGIPVRPPQPYIEVKVDRGKIILQAGRLQGMTPGSQFSVYAAGKEIKNSEPVAKAEVEFTELTTSTLKITTPEVNDHLLENLRAARAFETSHRFGDERLKVVIYNLTDDSNDSEVISQIKTLDLVNHEVKEAEPWDVRICRGHCPDETTPGGEKAPAFAGGITLERSNGSIVARIADGANAAAQIKMALEGEARWQFVKGLNNDSDPNMQVKIRLVPVTDVVISSETGLATSARKLGEEVTKTEGGQIELREGNYVMLEIMNMGPDDVWVTVLDIDGEGAIGPLWPHPNVPVGQSGENKIPGAKDGKPVWTPVPIPYVIEITKPYGPETFKAIVTRTETNFSPLLQRATSENIQRGGMRGGVETQSLLGQVLMTATTGLSKTRRGITGADPAHIVMPLGWATTTVTFSVKQKNASGT